MQWHVVVVAVGALGCACKRAPREQAVRRDAATIAARDASPATAPLTLVTAAGPAELRHGKAYVERGVLEIRVSDVAGPCGSGFRPPWRAVAFIRVPAGPGGTFFAGAPFGTEISAGELGGMLSTYAAAASRVTLEPFTPRAGEVVRGTIDLGEAGGGSFAAELCAGAYASLPALPGAAPASPVTGTVGGKPFTVRKALATVQAHSETYQQLGTIELFDGDVTCATRKAADGPAQVMVHEIGGASTRARLAGSPQPATFVVRPARGAPHAYPDGGAWVQLDALAFEPGAKLRGALVVATHPGEVPATTVGGTFEAEVCPRE